MSDLTNTIRVVIRITHNGAVQQFETFVERTSEMATFDINLDNNKEGKINVAEGSFEKAPQYEGLK